MNFKIKHTFTYALFQQCITNVVIKVSLSLMTFTNCQTVLT